MKKKVERKSTKQLVGRFPGHKLSQENHRGLMPACYNVEMDYRVVAEGYKLVGWASPPYAGSQPHAIIFLKTSPADTSLTGDEFPPGYFWVHGNADSPYWKA